MDLRAAASASLLSLGLLLPAAATHAAPACQQASSVTSGDTHIIAAVEAHPDGGWVTAYAHSWYSDHSYSSAVVERYAADGGLLWTWQAGAFWPSLKAQAMTVLPDGAIVVGGQAGEYSDWLSGHFLRRIDPDGQSSTSWSSGPSYSFQTYIQLAAMPDDGVAAVLRTWSGAPSRLERRGPDGAILWEHDGTSATVAPWDFAEARALETDPTGAILIAAHYKGGSPFVAHLTADGALLWEVDLTAAAGLDDVRDLALSGPDILVAGDAAGAPALAWLDLAGALTATTTLPADAIDVAHSVEAHADGGWSVAGDVFGSPSTEGALLRLDPSGAVTWAETFGTTLFDEAFTHHAVLSDGQLVAAGPYESAAIVAFWTVLTTDACGDPAPGCVSDADCDDGSPCNGAETCHFGDCAPGTPVDCSSFADACHDAACDDATGACDVWPLPAPTPCDDGDACTTADICGQTSTCAGTPVSCDDGDPCTADACHPASGCSSTPDTSLPSCTPECSEWSLTAKLGVPYTALYDAVILPGGDVVAQTYGFTADQVFGGVRAYNRVGAQLYDKKWGGWLQFGPPHSDTPTAIAQLEGGAYALASKAGFPPAPTLRVLSASGALLWTTSEPASLGTTVADVADAGDGAVALAGSYAGFARVRKSLPGGAPAWDWASTVLPGAGLVTATAIAPRPVGGHVVAGTATVSGSTAAWVVTLDADGEEILAISLDDIEPLSDVVDVVAQGSRLIVLGVPKGDPGRATLLALTSAGTPLWRRTFGGGGVERVPHSLRAAPGGLLSVVGSIQYGDADRDGWYLLVGHRGKRIVEDVVGEPGVDDWFTGHDRGDDGAVVLVGRRPNPTNIWQGEGWIQHRCDL